MKLILKTAAAAMALLMMGGCASNETPVNGVGAEDGQDSNIVEEEIDYMQAAKDFMSKFEAEIECPEELKKKEDGIDYGELVRTTYYSETCEKDRNVNIVLPAGYSDKKEYPVMYILHGIFGDQNSMLGDGDPNIRTVIENMIHGGEAEEMILVFPYMYASKTQDVCTGIDVENELAYDNFVNDLVNDLMPFMAENYSVAEGRDNTAVIGFSMGGREALAIGLQVPDKIGYIGAISPAPGLVPGKDWAMDHPGQFAEDEVKYEGDIMPYLIMICSGDSDHTVGTFPKSYHELMDKNEVTHVWYEIPGSDHGNPAIQSGIYNFCKNVFKAK